jgi:hypothetical protein
VRVNVVFRSASLLEIHIHMFHSARESKVQYWKSSVVSSIDTIFEEYNI